MKDKKQFTSGKNIIDIYKNGSSVIVDLNKLSHQQGKIPDTARFEITLDFVEYLFDLANDVWGSFKPKECSSAGSDYYEYYDKEYDNNGYLSISHDKKYLDFELPASHLGYNRMYKFNKVKLQSLIYDLKNIVSKN